MSSDVIRFVLDTNIVSLLMKSDEAVMARGRALAPEEIGIPQPVLAEIRFGIERLGRTKRREQLEAQLERIRSALPCLAWTDDVSRRFGEAKAALERAGTIVEDFDVAIAAHALSLDATLVTSNVEHMARIKALKIEDWASPGLD